MKPKTRKPAKLTALTPNRPCDVPTAILTGIHGTVTVVRKLYGPVSPTRLADEQRDVNHRAEQLDPPKRKPPVERPEMTYKERYEQRVMEAYDDRF